MNLESRNKRKLNKIRRERNTQSLPKIKGGESKSSPGGNTMNASPKMIGDDESVTTIAKVSETERKNSKPKGPKKLVPLRRKIKSKFILIKFLIEVNNLIPISVTSTDVHVDQER